MSTRRSRINVRPNVGPRAPKTGSTASRDVKKIDTEDLAKEKELLKPGTNDTETAVPKEKPSNADPPKAPPRTSQQSSSQVAKASNDKDNNVPVSADAPDVDKSKQLSTQTLENNSQVTGIVVSHGSESPVIRQRNKSSDTSNKTSNGIPAVTINKYGKIGKAKGPAVATAPRPTPQVSSEEKLSDASVVTEPLPASKPPEASRPRSRFIRPKPNLSEAGRPRVRHPSMSASDSEDDFHRQPPSVQRITSIPSASSTPSSPAPVGQSPSFGGLTSGNTHTATNSHTQESTGKEERQTEKKVRRKRERVKTVPSDRTKMTMKDLIYYNPSPAEKTGKTTERRASVDSVSSIAKDNPASREQVLESLCENVAQTPAVQPKDPEKPEGEDEDGGMAMPVPQVKVGPDGSIIINEESIVIDSPARPIVEAGEVLHEDGDTETTYASFRKKQKYRNWTTKETIKFYKALSIVGTDFSMMSNVITKRTRVELKNKFKREERTNKLLIDKALRERQDFDPDLFSHSDSENEPEVANSKQTEKKAGRKRKRPDKKPNEDGNKNASAVPRKRKNKKKTIYEDSDSADEVHAEEDVNANPSPKTAESYIRKAIAMEREEKEEEEEEEDVEEEDEIISKICRPTKSGRVPKPVQPLNIVDERTNRKSRTVFTKELASSAGQSIAGQPPLLRASPSPLTQPRILQSPPDVNRQVRSPQFMSLTSPVPGQGEGQINVNQLSPGQQLVFVTGNPAAAAPSNQTAGGKKFIHVFVMSPTGNLQSMQEEQGMVTSTSNSNQGQGQVQTQGNAVRHVLPSSSGGQPSPLRSMLTSPQQQQEQSSLHHNNLLPQHIFSSTPLQHMSSPNSNQLSPLRDASLLIGAPLVRKRVLKETELPTKDLADSNSSLAEFTPVGINPLNNRDVQEVGTSNTNQQGES